MFVRASRSKNFHRKFPRSFWEPIESNIDLAKCGRLSLYRVGLRSPRNIATDSFSLVYCVKLFMCVYFVKLSLISPVTSIFFFPKTHESSALKGTKCTRPKYRTKGSDRLTSGRHWSQYNQERRSSLADQLRCSRQTHWIMYQLFRY